MSPDMFDRLVCMNGGNPDESLIRSCGSAERKL